jgi:hypothetical protein
LSPRGAGQAHRAGCGKTLPRRATWNPWIEYARLPAAGHRAPENRYLIVNCFEAAVAIYFLAPETVERIWAKARAAGRQDSYTVTAVEDRNWPRAWSPPSALRDRLSFDPGSSLLVLHGALTERERNALLAQLPANRRAVEELFEKSRLLPEATIL